MNDILQGNVTDKLKEIETGTVQCVVTSPPYWGLRDYGTEGQIGLEETPEKYVEKMVEVFREVKRVLKHDGTVWLNLGDSYSTSSGTGGTKSFQPKQPMFAYTRKAPKNLKPKDLVGIPWRVAFALQADGWYLRQDIIWHKPNPMPEPVQDRCTKAHEYIFLLTKSSKYYYDIDSIREPSKRNRRSVWTINTQPYKEAHFATFPQKIPELCIKAGSKEDDVVLDPFFGSGTTGYVAQKLGRRWIGIELNEDYIKIAKKRLAQQEMFAAK